MLSKLHFQSAAAPASVAREDHEQGVTVEAADRAKEAAIKAVGSGTADHVTTDYFGDGYEVTMTMPDGSKVEVHLDSSFDVVGPSRSGAPPPLPGWN